MTDTEPKGPLAGLPVPGRDFISAEVIEAEMQAAFDGCDPQVGLLGPDTLSWEVYSQKAIWFCAMRCSLLQCTHPGVATALVEKSSADSATRLQTTIDFMDGVVFGTVDRARSLAMMLHGKHMAVSGTLSEPGGVHAVGDAYEGNDLDALLWVLATIFDGAVMLYDRFVEPMSRADRDRLIGELPPLAAMFGIPRVMIPADWAAFEAYFEAMLSGPRTHIGDTARRAAQNILQVSGPSPMHRLVRAMTVGWLPPAVREGYGLSWDLPTRAMAKVGHGVVRAYANLQPARNRRAKGFIDGRVRLGLPPLP